MAVVACLFMLILLFQQKYSLAGQLLKKVSYNVPFWQEIDNWSKCSTTCGEGFEEKVIECFRQTFYITENIPAEKCNNAKKPTPKIRKCNFGNCDQQYVWKMTDWGKCSHSCGYAGVQMNEVECFVKLDSEKYTATDPEKCNEIKKPVSLRSCNKFNCPVNFQAYNWGDCIASSECSPGKQRRNLTCLSLLSSGKLLYLPRAACYQKGVIPPSSWKKCYDHIDEDKCSLKKKKELEPEITEQKRSLVQMRKVNRLNLYVGHIAYIILGTKVMITCPVKNFLQMNLIWLFKDSKYSYNGKSQHRVKVNKKGKLIIKSFQMQDQGVWTCQAANVTATVVVKFKSPSDGFKDWAIRNTLWNKEMPNEDSQMDMLNNEVVRWVTGSWSKCSISCDGVGTQSRFVRCEKLENRYYYKLDDSDCLKHMKMKPDTKRECHKKSACPKWSNLNGDLKTCSNKCITVGKGTIGGELKCIYENQVVDSDQCDPTTKPFQECFNPSCIVEWKKSTWTKCSRSCGEQGFQARYLMCIWKDTNDFAGNQCYKAGLKVPRVLKSCKPPQCKLDCIDLFQNCKRKRHYCKLKMYHFRCCQTCREYFQILQSESKKKKI